MAFDRVFIEIYPDLNCLTYTEAHNCGSVIPDKIIQKRYPLKPKNDLFMVSKKELLTKLFECSKIKNRSKNIEKYLTPLYANSNLYNSISWLEFSYLAVYVFNILNKNLFKDIVLDTDIPLCVIEEKDKPIENLDIYTQGYDINEYIEEIRLGNRYMPIQLYLSYTLLKTKINTLTNDSMFREISKRDLKLLEGWLK